MFMRVDFPAPFSPRSACTSPFTRSKSTWSLATTPGNRFVMPFSSRRAGSAMGGGRQGAGTVRAPCISSLFERIRHRDGAVHDGRDLSEGLVDRLLRRVRRELTQ